MDLDTKHHKKVIHKSVVVEFFIYNILKEYFFCRGLLLLTNFIINFFYFYAFISRITIF